VSDIFTAAWLGDLAGVAEWLDADPGLVNAPDPAEDFRQVTPLAHALAGGDTNVVSFLIGRGAEVRAHSGQLLSIAIILNRPDLVALLLDHGADASRSGSLGVLDQAERPIADLLVTHGGRVPDGLLARSCRADVSRNEVHRVRVLLAYGADVNGRSREGLTPLHYAVRSGKLPLIRLLLDHGADVNAPDPAGLTPVHHLAKSRAKIDPAAAQAIRDLLTSRDADAPAVAAAG
jgi:ankyrin repeat protein